MAGQGQVQLAIGQRVLRQIEEVLRHPLGVDRADKPANARLHIVAVVVSPPVAPRPRPVPAAPKIEADRDPANNQHAQHSVVHGSTFHTMSPYIIPSSCTIINPKSSIINSKAPGSGLVRNPQSEIRNQKPSPASTPSTKSTTSTSSTPSPRSRDFVLDSLLLNM